MTEPLDLDHYSKLAEVHEGTATGHIMKQLIVRVRELEARLKQQDKNVADGCGQMFEQQQEIERMKQAP